MASQFALPTRNEPLTIAFNSCIQTFSLLDAGQTCGRDYQESALKLSLLGLRLARWEEVYRTSKSTRAPGEGHLAKAALESVKASLERLCMTTGQSQPSDGWAGIANATEKVQALTLRRAKTSVDSKFIWALEDKRVVDDVMQTIRCKIEELENLSPELAPTLKQLAEDEAKELLQPSQAENEPPLAIPILKKLAADVDPSFGEAVSNSTGHYYENVVVLGDGTLHKGNAVAEGYTGELRESYHSYKDVKSEGNAVVHAGDSYGKSIFD